MHGDWMRGEWLGSGGDEKTAMGDSEAIVRFLITFDKIGTLKGGVSGALLVSLSTLSRHFQEEPISLVYTHRIREKIHGVESRQKS